MGVIRNGSFFSAYNGNEIDGRLTDVAQDNLLINGDFRNPVNQRGSSSYSGAVDTLDRWKSSASLTVTLNTGYITISSSGSSGISFYQPLDFDSYKGREVTGSILTSNGTLYTATGTIPNALPASGSSSVFSTNTSAGLFRLLASQARSDLEFALTVNSGNSISLVAAKLEFGAVQTLARNVGTEANPQWVLNDPPPKFQSELNKCKAYQIVWKNSSGNVSFIGGGFVGTSTVARIKIPVGVYMKAQPVLKSLGTNSYTADDCSLVVDNRMIPVKSFDSLWARDVDGFYVNANVDSSESMTVNSLALLRVNTSAAIIADAN